MRDADRMAAVLEEFPDLQDPFVLDAVKETALAYALHLRLAGVARDGLETNPDFLRVIYMAGRTSSRAERLWAALRG